MINEVKSVVTYLYLNKQQFWSDLGTEQMYTLAAQIFMCTLPLLLAEKITNVS